MQKRRKAQLILAAMAAIAAAGATRQWTATDGLPTGEVRQIVELPNGQMLINCEGVFCLSNGLSFTPLPCDRSRALPLSRFGRRYMHLWQGDSLLFLRDLYQVYLFDARTRSFRYDFRSHAGSPQLRRIANPANEPGPLPPQLKRVADSLGIARHLTCAVTDRQGGTWMGTTRQGIVYLPPRRPAATAVADAAMTGRLRGMRDSRGRWWQWRDRDGVTIDDRGRTTHLDAANVKGMSRGPVAFVHELAGGRYLICQDLNRIGYLWLDRRRVEWLNARLPRLDRHRHYVGACNAGGPWTVVYSQNGALMLNTQADTLAPLGAEREMAPLSNKYNCMLRDRGGQLWVGTQNGLFCLTPTAALPGGAPRFSCRRIRGLANNCIRSVVADGRGHIWAGTSCGVSQVTPAVVSYGPDDGIPAVQMTERAALLGARGQLLFGCGQETVVAFRPEWLASDSRAMAVALTALLVNSEPAPLRQIGADMTCAYNRNNLTFQFSALNYAAPSHTRYRYRLGGLERGWQPYVGTERRLATADYRALPPGTYTFEVQAAAGNGPWGAVTRQTVTIRPPLWLTWWAKAGYGALALAVAALLIHYYIRQKQKRMERENDRRVNRLFELREQARHRFAASTNVDPKKIGVNGEEERLVEKMLKAIEANMENAGYGVDQLAADTAMSRTALYTRLRDMLGISPADFIRNVRLKRAAQLLADTQLPVSEVAARVGYGTHKAFSANFRKAFGVPPSEYKAARAARG